MGDAQVVRFGKIVMIHDLKRQGLRLSAIARQTARPGSTERPFTNI